MAAKYNATLYSTAITDVNRSSTNNQTTLLLIALRNLLQYLSARVGGCLF